jgi:phosphoenolpyruvate carboxylase
MPSTLKLSQREATFNNEVVARFELYNSLFQTLPFYQVKDTGILLPFFSSHCDKGAGKAVIAYRNYRIVL